MKITLAKSAGFCFGVSRAVKGSFNLIEMERGQKFATLGELIHNPQIVNKLLENGVRLIENPMEAEPTEIVIIRSHGIEKSDYEKLEAQAVHYVDFTCPYVKKIHHIVENADRDGDLVFIIGHESHPEVVGIKSYAGNARIFSDVFELEEYTRNINDLNENGITVVVQTTFDIKKWETCRNFIKKYYTKAKISDTICKATEKRQSEAETLSENADAVFVVGGRSSSNTRRLYEVCKKKCDNTFLIESEKEIISDMIENKEYVVVTAGASTPQSAIDEVMKRLGEF